MPGKSFPSILVIDDEPDNFNIISLFLNEEEYVLNYVPSGQEALDRLRVFQPDVILLDLMMPNMNGIEFCKIFKENPQWKHIPIIMITSLTSREELGHCLAAGADDFINKPVSSTELHARLQSMLRIKKQYDSIQELLLLREDMVKMIVHDLRNPITTILLAAEMLRQPNLSPAKKKLKLDQIITGGEELRSLVNDLLLMAKLESNKLILNRANIDLCELCQLSIASLQEIADQKNLQFTVKLPESRNVYVSVDPSLFRRTIDNLLSNAIKFSPNNSFILVEVEDLDNQGVRIQVSDSGPGVSDELKKSIFQKYEIGTLINGASQTGLGLAFCKIAIESHGGTITVTDNDPKGSIFTVELKPI